ncbi:hypothetical protein Droror1_Dr00026667, partial [Drosera rotundifolia]
PPTIDVFEGGEVIEETDLETRVSTAEIVGEEKARGEKEGERNWDKVSEATMATKGSSSPPRSAAD